MKADWLAQELPRTPLADFAVNLAWPKPTQAG
jgi:hypothetical protein